MRTSRSISKIETELATANDMIARLIPVDEWERRYRPTATQSQEAVDTRSMFTSLEV